ncbi:hypothetical protein [Dactylosporangium sp. CA-092794]|uniref:hypothetical protein n=1 Tax=Dactylosporangium sp. CA-092794 TaxID=3239929 RepID=UPI003D921703
MADGFGDPGSWDRLCLGFHTLRLASNRHGFERRWRGLAQQSRGGSPDLAAWNDLWADVEQRAEAEDDMTLRGGDGQAAADDDWDEPARDREFRCPQKLCGRVERNPFGDQPHCDLLGLDMSAA